MTRTHAPPSVLWSGMIFRSPRYSWNQRVAVCSPVPRPFQVEHSSPTASFSTTFEPNPVPFVLDVDPAGALSRRSWLNKRHCDTHLPDLACFLSLARRALSNRFWKACSSSQLVGDDVESRDDPLGEVMVTWNRVGLYETLTRSCSCAPPPLSGRTASSSKSIPGTLL